MNSILFLFSLIVCLFYVKANTITLDVDEVEAITNLQDFIDSIIENEPTEFRDRFESAVSDLATITDTEEFKSAISEITEAAESVRSEIDEDIGSIRISISDDVSAAASSSYNMIGAGVAFVLSIAFFQAL